MTHTRRHSPQNRLGRRVVRARGRGRIGRRSGATKWRWGSVASQTDLTPAEPRQINESK